MVIPRTEWPEGGGVAYQKDDSGAFQNAVRECVGSPRRGFMQIGARIFPGDSDWPSELRIPAGWPSHPVRTPNSYYDPKCGWGVTAPEPLGGGSYKPFGGPSSVGSNATALPSMAMAPPPGLSAPAFSECEGREVQREISIEVLLEGERVFCRSVRGEEISIRIDRTLKPTSRATHSTLAMEGLNLADEDKSHAKHPPFEPEPAEGSKPPEHP